MKYTGKLILTIIALLISALMLFISCSEEDNNDKKDKTEKDVVTEDAKTNAQDDKESQAEAVKVDVFAEEKSATREMVGNRFTLISNGLFSNVERYEALDFETVSTKLKAKLETDDGFEAFSNDVVYLQSVYEYMSSLAVGSVEVDMTLENNEAAIRTDVEGSVNDESVIDGSIIIDKENNGLYFELPDVSDDTYYIDISSGSSVDEFVDSVESLRETQLSVGDASEFALLLFDDKSAELTADYICYFFDLLGEGNESNVTLDIDGVSKEVRCVSYELTEERFNEISVDLLEIIKEDETFKTKIIEIVDFCIDNDFASDVFGAVSDGNEFYQDVIIPSIDVMISEINDSAVDTDNVVYIDLYFDGDALVGIIGDDGETVVTIASLENDNSSVTKFVVDDSGTVSGFSLIGTINDSLYSGTFTLYDGFDNTEYVIVFSDFDLDKYAEGVFSGTVKLDDDVVALFSDLSFSKELELIINFDSDGATYSDIKITANYGGKQAFTLDLNVDVDDNAGDIRIPNDYKDYDDMSVFSEALFKQSLINTLVENLVNAGVSRRALLDLAASFVM